MPSPGAGAAPDLVLHGGALLTQDPALPRAEALAVRGGRIQAVGSSADVLALAGPGTRRVDLGGRALIPGFNDAHIHVWKVGDLLTRQLDLRPLDSLAALAAVLRDAHARLPPGAWILGRGYNEARLAEGRSPDRRDLDAAAPGRAVFLIRVCGHIAVASSRALETAGINPGTAVPKGGAILRDASGVPTGVLHETAMGLVSSHAPEPTAAEHEAMVLAAARRQLSLGITTAGEAGVLPPLMAVYRALDARGALPYRVNAMALRRPLGGPETLPLPEPFVSDRLRADTVKVFADGGLSGATAALRVPYRGREAQEDRGLLRANAEELVELTREAHLKGLRVATHVIGDRAIDAVLDAYEALARLGPGPRHRLEHFGLPHPDQVARAVRLGAFAVPQAVFVHDLGRNFRQHLPDALLSRAYPLRDMLRAGLPVALSSDAPVVADENPLLGLRAAVLRRDEDGEAIAPEQSISAAEALFAYTMGGALASGDGGNRGSLTPGKWADLAVLTADPTAVPPEALADLRVDLTFVAGEPAFER
ncbi:MAG TPA: amidohydrolase [Myxococcaceae bacterium]|jgi:hypothetical protein